MWRDNDVKSHGEGVKQLRASGCSGRSRSNIRLSRSMGGRIFR